MKTQYKQRMQHTNKITTHLIHKKYNNTGASNVKYTNENTLTAYAI